MEAAALEDDADRCEDTPRFRAADRALGRLAL
jgi:hypothetical protein